MASAATLELYIVAKDQASKSLKSIGSNVETLGKQTDKLAKLDFGKFESGLASTAGALGKLALPMVGVGVAAGKMAMDFDTSLRNINSIAGLSESSLTDLGQSFIDLSLDSSKTLEGAGALADGFYDIQSSGFAGADGMKVLEAATKASSAGMTQTAVASKALTGALNAYGLGADEAGHVSDVMFQTVNAGVITFEQLAGSIGQVLPTAAAANVSIEQVGAAIASMTKSGIAGSVAVTDLNSLINSVIKPTKEASDAAKTFGFDLSLAALQSKGLNGFLADMVQKTGGGAENISKLITSQEGLAAALSLTKGDLKGFNADLAGMEASAGAADKAFQEMSKAASSQIKIAKKDLEAAAITIGSELLPRVVDVTKAIASMAESFAKLPKDERDKYTNIALGVGELVIGMYALTKATQGAIAAGKTLTTIYGGLTAAFGATLIPLTGFALAAGAGTLAAKNLEQSNLDAAIGYDKIIDAANTASPAMQNLAEANSRVTDAMAAENPKIDETRQKIAELTKERQSLLVTLEHAPTSTDPLGLSGIVDPAADAKRRAALAGIEKQIGALGDNLRALTKDGEGTSTVFRGITGSMAPFTSELSAAAAAATDTTAALALTDEQITALDKNLITATEGGLDAFRERLDTVGKNYDDLATLTAGHEDALAQLIIDKGHAKTDAERTAVDERIAAENEGYQRALGAQLIAQGEQLGAQRTHLGEMLIAQITTMDELGTISDDRARALVDAIRTEYGVLPDLAATTFGAMQGSITTFADNAGMSVESLTTRLETTGQTAEETRGFMEMMAKVYTAELQHNFDEGKISAEELTIAVSKIPARIQSLLDTNWADQLAQIRAIGGAMGALPASKLIRIEAGIDPMLMRRSPSPIEQVMMAVTEFERRPHIFQLGTTGDVSALTAAGGGTHIGPANTGGSHIGPLKQALNDTNAAADAIQKQPILRGFVKIVEDVANRLGVGVGAIVDASSGMSIAGPKLGNDFVQLGRQLGIGASAVVDAGSQMSIAGPNFGEDIVQIGRQLGVGAGMVVDAANKMSIAGPKFGQAIAAASDATNKLGQGVGASNTNKLGQGTGQVNDQPDPMKTFAPRAAESGTQAGQGAGMGFGTGWQQGITEIMPQVQQTLVTMQDVVFTPWQDATREFFGGAGFGFIGAASVGIQSAGGGLAQSAAAVGGSAGSAIVGGLRGSVPGVSGVVGEIQGIVNSLKDKTITVHVQADIDPALQRYSPSIVEQTLMSIADLARTMPAVPLRTSGSLPEMPVVSPWAPAPPAYASAGYSAPSASSGGGSSASSTSLIVNVDARGSTLTERQIDAAAYAGAQRALREAGRNADTTRRTG